jgi:hypothetical protein
MRPTTGSTAFVSVTAFRDNARALRTRAGYFREGAEQFPIIVRFRPDDCLTSRDLESLSVRTRRPIEASEETGAAGLGQPQVVVTCGSDDITSKSM